MRSDRQRRKVAAIGDRRRRKRGYAAKAEANAVRAQHQLAISYIDRSINELEYGDRAFGLAILGQAYRAADDAKDSGLRHSVCSLIGAWDSTVGHIRYPMTARLTAVAFSPDGTKVATAS